MARTSSLLLRFSPNASPAAEPLPPGVGLRIVTQLPEGVRAWPESTPGGLFAQLAVPFGPCGGVRLLAVDPAVLPWLVLQSLSYQGSDPAYSAPTVPADPEDEPLLIGLEDDGHTLTPGTEWSLCLRLPSGDLFADWVWPTGQFSVSIPAGGDQRALTLGIASADLSYPLRLVSPLSDEETALIATRLPPDAPRFIAEDDRLVPADPEAALFEVDSATVGAALQWLPGDYDLILRAYRPDGAMDWQGWCMLDNDIGLVTVTESNPAGEDPTGDLLAARVRIQYTWPICHSVEFVGVLPTSPLAPLQIDTCAYNESSIQYDGLASTPLPIYLDGAAVAPGSDWRLCVSFPVQNLWSHIDLTARSGQFTWTPRPGVEDPQFAIALDRFDHPVDGVDGVRYPMRIIARKFGTEDETLIAERIQGDSPILVTQGEQTIRLKPRQPDDPPPSDPDRPDGVLFQLDAVDIAAALDYRTGLYELLWRIYEGEGQIVYNGFCRSREEPGPDDLLPPVRGMVPVGEAMTEKSGAAGLMVDSEAQVAWVQIAPPAVVRLIDSSNRHLDIASDGTYVENPDGPAGPLHWLGSVHGETVVVTWSGSTVWSGMRTLAGLASPADAVAWVVRTDLVDGTPTPTDYLLYASRAGAVVTFRLHRLSDHVEITLGHGTLSGSPEEHSIITLGFSPSGHRCFAAFGLEFIPVYESSGGVYNRLVDYEVRNGVVQECLLPDWQTTGQTMSWAVVSTGAAPDNLADQVYDETTGGASGEAICDDDPDETPRPAGWSRTTRVDIDVSWVVNTGAWYDNETLVVLDWTVRYRRQQVSTSTAALNTETCQYEGGGTSSGSGSLDVTRDGTTMTVLAYQSSGSESGTWDGNMDEVEVTRTGTDETVYCRHQLARSLFATDCIRDLWYCGPTGTQVYEASTRAVDITVDRACWLAFRGLNWPADDITDGEMVNGDYLMKTGNIDHGYTADALGVWLRKQLSSLFDRLPTWWQEYYGQTASYQFRILRAVAFARPTPAVLLSETHAAYLSGWGYDWYDIPSRVYVNNYLVSGLEFVAASGACPVVARAIFAPPDYPPIPDGGPAPPNTSVYDLFNLHLTARAGEGLDPWQYDTRLEQAALAHATWLATQEEPSHTGQGGSSPHDRAVAAGYPATHRVEENLAVMARDVDEVMEAWLVSPGHRAKILAPGTTHFGAATLGDTPWGRLWVCLIGEDLTA